MKKIIKFNNQPNSSTIIIKSNYVDRYIKNLMKKNKKIFCIIDTNVRYILRNYKNKKNFNIIFIKSSEKIKTISNYNKICENLLSKKIDRESIIIAIGGGTLGDICGFVASSLLRGISFSLIPTTLLSQVDSSIGGKNGINTKYGKNLIGSFYNPNEILIDTKILKTLPQREIRSGYAEIVKHAIIKDINFFEWLEINHKKIFNYNLKILEEAILRSIMIKLWYVRKDPKENLKNNNSRSMLNFGHSFGHALETFYNYNRKINHGEAISIGMVTEAIISNKLKYLSDIELNRIISHFSDSRLKIYDKNINNNKIFKILLKDKKNFDNQINMALIKKIGNSFFAKKINLNKIKKILDSL